MPGSRAGARGTKHGWAGGLTVTVVTLVLAVTSLTAGAQRRHAGERDRAGRVLRHDVDDHGHRQPGPGQDLSPVPVRRAERNRPHRDRLRVDERRRRRDRHRGVRQPRNQGPGGVQIMGREPAGSSRQRHRAACDPTRSQRADRHRPAPSSPAPGTSSWVRGSSPPGEWPTRSRSPVATPTRGRRWSGTRSTRPPSWWTRPGGTPATSTSTPTTRTRTGRRARRWSTSPATPGSTSCPSPST